MTLEGVAGSSVPRPLVVAVGPFPRYGDLIDELGLPRASEPAEDHFLLLESGQGLELRPPGELARPGLRAVFPPDREAATSRARPPISRAFGSRIHTVLDLTAGLGGDACRLAAAGHRVEAWEREPALVALVLSAWSEALDAGRVPPEVASRLSFHGGDAVDGLGRLGGHGVGAYLDPMYPGTRGRSARPRRALQILRVLIPDEEPPLRLLQAARERVARVVVKRPHRAPPLAEGVSFTTRTKLLRLDVYVNPELSREPSA